MSNLEQEVNELVKEIPKKLKILDQKLGAIDTQSQLNPSFNDSKLSQRRSGALDDFFISLCEPFAEILGIGDNLLISASGSYGRNEHVPKSDTDIIVIGRTEDKSLNMLSKILMYDIYAGGSKYVFGEGLNSLINLKQLACYEKNEFISFEFDDKLESKYNINEIVELLKRFVEIKNYKECNLVKYDVEYI